MCRPELWDSIAPRTDRDIPHVTSQGGHLTGSCDDNDGWLPSPHRSQPHPPVPPGPLSTSLTYGPSQSMSVLYANPTLDSSPSCHRERRWTGRSLLITQPFNSTSTAWRKGLMGGRSTTAAVRWPGGGTRRTDGVSLGGQRRRRQSYRQGTPGRSAMTMSIACSTLVSSDSQPSRPYSPWLPSRSSVLLMIWCSGRSGG
ncbi:hypothetical protein L227DRAFT_372891 [Lentinus tigrinus ALCF2SS1-6]|uniref:Uncharacterized protein n=1 Tax=Lentinus tigrinus ALCF2SS1-6 TaxID=1328759 RepID=A0A5C2RV34_9APHY|nr:hypothetical protein L227DRAFT_372891 [Lentinus tigrinus ALCF2SS1-6]